MTFMPVFNQAATIKCYYKKQAYPANKKHTISVLL